MFLVSPTTLLAALNTVEQLWRQDRLDRQADEIVRLGAELYERLATVLRHVQTLGGTLTKAVATYNSVVGSIKSGLLPSARGLRKSGLRLRSEAPAVRRIDEAVRSIGANTQRGSEVTLHDRPTGRCSSLTYGVFMIRRTSNTIATSLAGTVAHLIGTSGSLFFLLLISRDAYSSLARTGHARLRTLITQRIQRRATALVALLGFGDGDADAEVTRLTNAALPVVMLSVLSCRPGGPQEFVRWLDRRIEQALYGQPLDAPPSAAVPPRLALTLRQLPIPIDG